MNGALAEKDLDAWLGSPLLPWRSPWESLGLSRKNRSLLELQIYHLLKDIERIILEGEKRFLIYGRYREHWLNPLDCQARWTWLTRGFSLYSKYCHVVCLNMLKPWEQLNIEWMNEWMSEWMSASISNISGSRGSDWPESSSKCPKCSNHQWFPTPPNQHSAFLRNP